MPFPAPDPELALDLLTAAQPTAPLFEEARRSRDEGKGRSVTHSRKVFIPVTTMCRDRCTYCTFAKPPGAGGVFLTPDEVMAVVRAGERHGCTEALFTLGDRPEDRWPAGPSRARIDTRVRPLADGAGCRRLHVVPTRQSRADGPPHDGGAPTIQSVDGADAREHLAAAHGAGNAALRVS